MNYLVFLLRKKEKSKQLHEMLPGNGALLNFLLRAVVSAMKSFRL